MDDETAMDNVTLDDERLTREDVAHLEWARTLARGGWGRVHPNPLVGCVIVRDGRLVGQGYHAEFGGPHAEIVALGEGVTDREVGQRVVGYAGQTGYASMAAIPAASTFLLPEGADAAEACALIIAYGTSHHALKQRAQLKPGETLVVFGAAGATGVAAVQIGKIMGATVIAVVSSEEKGKIAKECGADHVIGYEGLKDKVKELTGGKGADVCYDVVGGEAFDAASRFMARNGRLLVIGFASGDIPKFPVNLALVKEYAVVGVFWGNFTRAEPQVYAENMRELLDWFGSRTVKPIVAGRFPLKDAAEVLETVLGRGGVGKFALIPEGV